MLALEIELLTGAYRAALPDGSGPEWPPHPERIFSALVQAWADGGQQPDEREALEWIEALAPPAIEVAESVSSRDAGTVYVPPNDFETAQPMKPFEWPVDKKTGARKPIRDVAWAGVEPGIRAWSFRQARTFEASVPSSDGVTILWDVARPEAMAAALDRLARRVASVGHSSSLVRCAWKDRAQVRDDRAWRASAAGTATLRVPYRGRMADLARWWGESARPRSRAAVRYSQPNVISPQPAESVFGQGPDWLIFESADGQQPDILALAHVTRRVRDALMSVGPQPVPELLSGHQLDGSPAQKPHVAVLPLLDVGWSYSQGSLLGLAVVLPRGATPEERRPVLQALAVFARGEAGASSSVAKLRLSRTFEWTLEHAPAPSRASLRAERWCRTSESWASVTPVLLDRFPDRDDPLEEARIISQACRNIGLPEPTEIEIHKHPAVRGAPSASYSRRSGLTWSFPAASKLTSKPRRHVVLRFARPVSGPVVVGAGRYHGFGLCLPFEEATGS